VLNAGLGTQNWLVLDTEDELTSELSSSHGFLQLLDGHHLGAERLAISKLRGPVTALRIQEIEQARRSAPVGILTDVT